ncbi:M23 family metallopeptidase [Streptomyces sp. AA0539]|uniref:M23 family metallopeptidase n=1 Tax=Streptomyces sp. AA0539 TaxID=1210045 RepID=UPI0003013E3B|nr:M23 family metallopeptidase [Streptomyces sp. AA0539]
MSTYRVCFWIFVALAALEVVHGIPVFLPWAFLLVAVVSQYLSTRAPRDHTPPPAVEVAAPVTGRWLALNSPADKVPSHGTYQYGQSHAIDIAAEPADGSRPAFGWWPLSRPARAFPAFGAPLLAVADGTVVSARDTQRDHRSRNSWPALPYLLFEGLFRDLVSARRVIGNQLVLDLGNGTYALYAHLRKGSLRVRAGDRVTAGQTVAECGNTGNSSEPHVHFQLMDHPDPAQARGIPFTWTGVGVPANLETFTPPASVPAGAGPARPETAPTGSASPGQE